MPPSPPWGRAGPGSGEEATPCRGTVEPRDPRVLWGTAVAPSVLSGSGGLAWGPHFSTLPLILISGSCCQEQKVGSGWSLFRTACAAGRGTLSFHKEGFHRRRLLCHCLSVSLHVRGEEGWLVPHLHVGTSRYACPLPSPVCGSLGARQRVDKPRSRTLTLHCRLAGERAVLLGAGMPPALKMRGFCLLCAKVSSCSRVGGGGLLQKSCFVRVNPARSGRLIAGT